MSSQSELKDGYIRADTPLKLLDSSTTVLSMNPKWGHLNLSTDEGRLTLKITADCAEDLIIDLRNFLTATSCSTDPPVD